MRIVSRHRRLSSYGTELPRFLMRMSQNADSTSDVKLSHGDLYDDVLNTVKSGRIMQPRRRAKSYSHCQDPTCCIQLTLLFLCFKSAWKSVRLRQLYQNWSRDRRC
ncbi:unnamed protein product [Albugo candida]|uniref:Uncharacterized protein n=1 Tax=Albugo candida TaxID=65357 RepID=A0A024FTI3_9STRA|nr:unnamed protein product [Albugo candida]|eukprot:CCI10336.1 unnamed protein product [Albugo candida]